MATRLQLLIALAVIVAPAGAAGSVSPGDDAVVIAVVDSGLWAPAMTFRDFRADAMPQALDGDASNDLPLDEPPHRWLPGFPSPLSFKSYASTDAPGTSSLNGSTWNVHYAWRPGTKVIGYVNFNPKAMGMATGQGVPHGTAVASIAAGNVFGACAECLLVFVNIPDCPAPGCPGPPNALRWALQQPWIDVVTTSWGLGSTVAGDRVLIDKDLVSDQRAAATRGQMIFSSAGNGVASGAGAEWRVGDPVGGSVIASGFLSTAYLVPQWTYSSSMVGPDWVTTVGAVTPQGGAFTGTGRPVDIAAPGQAYPAVGAREDSYSLFGGTSAATPAVAGAFARALSWARNALAGPSRIQSDDVVATGTPLDCGQCVPGDGAVTSKELREGIFRSADAIPTHTQLGYLGQFPATAHEMTRLAVGHGVLWVRSKGDAVWAAEFDRLLSFLDGRRHWVPSNYGPGEREWAVVDSFCRQKLWGSWSGGAFGAGETFPEPSAAYPIRSALAASCPDWPSLV